MHDLMLGIANPVLAVVGQPEREKLERRREELLTELHSLDEALSLMNSLSEAINQHLQVSNGSTAPSLTIEEPKQEPEQEPKQTQRRKYRMNDKPRKTSGVSDQMLARVRTYMAQHPGEDVIAPEVGRAVGVKPATVRNALIQLHERGEVRLVGRGEVRNGGNPPWLYRWPDE